MVEENGMESGENMSRAERKADEDRTIKIL
jgi:hypothetical protein